MLEKMLREKDAEKKMATLSQFMTGMIYCPTGQQSALEFLCASLAGEEIKNTDEASLRAQIRLELIRLRDQIFDRIVTVNRSQNTHVREVSQR